jgi:hypothetical protein
LQLRFSIVRDIFIAPQRAYADILATRSWLPAYFVVLAAGYVYLAATAPAVAHLASLTPGAAHRTPAQVSDAARSYIAGAAFYNSVQPLLIWGLIAMAFTSVARFKKQTASFGAFFALAAAASVPSALGEIIDAAGVRLHAANSFLTIKSLVTTVPDNFALLGSAANDREIIFLSSFGFFDVWSTVLLAYGFVSFAKVKIVTALALSFFLDVTFALVFTTP